MAQVIPGVILIRTKNPNGFFIGITVAIARTTINDLSPKLISWRAKVAKAKKPGNIFFFILKQEWKSHLCTYVALFFWAFSLSSAPLVPDDVGT